MENDTARAPSSAAPTLPPSLRLGAVHLTVPDIDRSVTWYRRALGLVARRRDPAEAELGDDSESLVVLHEDPAAHPPGRHAGLYHYALLYPEREALAQAALRLADTRTPIQGASDHGTHEAIYLGDVDGNGIELAADRPRERWPSGLGYRRGPAPLDVDSLLATGAGAQPGAIVANGVRVGHVHLHVGDIDRALTFYRDILGFEEQANLGTAAFVSAAGYHHHLGFNVWRGRGVAPAPAHTIGLRQWTVLLPSGEEVAAVRARADAAAVPTDRVEGGFSTRDPWENTVAFLATEPPSWPGSPPDERGPTR